jgi:hypothetical protein
MRHSRAPFEIACTERVNEREAGERVVSVAVELRAVGDNRPQPEGEDTLQVYHERSRRMLPR